MIIENPEAFKSWLTSILEPLCDADPAALAKYVYALVKKDKPLQELREGMLDQLDVFLQQETKPFVDMLFKSLESNDYLKPSERKASPPPQPAEEKEPEADAAQAPPPTTTNGSEESRPAVPERARRCVLPARTAAPGAKLPPVPAAPAVPHRGPHNEQTLVKVLPLSELLDEPVDHAPRRRDRRADSLRDKEERRRRRSRSWERRARARRHPRDGHDDRRRAASKSPSPRGRYRNRSPPAAVVDRVASRSRSRSPVPVREREHDRERERLRVPRELERDRMSRDREHRDRMSISRDRDRSRERSRERSRGSVSPRPDHADAYKRRCRDFDEKGYCMRGDLCQWDHGTDPLVLEDAALTRVLTVPPAVPEYNPLTPDIWCGAPAFAPYPHPPPHAHPHPMPLPHPPRELIPIPSFPPRLRATGPAPAPRHAPPHRKHFDYARLGAPRPPLPANAANCSLEVKKVPRGLNDITHLNNHFCKFGKIVNIQVCFEGDPEAALITFSNPTEANVAYKSTEAVLNNRFIKVFWHNPENKQENTAPTGQQQNRQQDKNQHQSHNKVLINRDNIKATADSKQLADKEKLAKETANGQTTETKKEPAKPAYTSKQVMERMKRAQALLEKQLQQQQLLIKKLESGNVNDSQKAALLDAIKSAQEGIEKLRSQLIGYNGILMQMQGETVARSMSRLKLQVNAKKPKTRQEAEKEILDAELDLFTKQQEGQDVTELAKKVAELRKQMAIQFPSHPAARRPHSRGGRFNTTSRFVRGGAQKVFSVNQSVDHRPRALLVSGFEPDELDALLQHFMQYGEVTSKEVNLSVPELVVQYRARAHAEAAAAQGRHYSDRTLSITWVANTKPVGIPPAPAIHNGDNGEEKEPEASAELSAAALLRFDEEEEDDGDEDRSWRR